MPSATRPPRPIPTRLNPTDAFGVLGLIRTANTRVTQYKDAAKAHRRIAGVAVSAKATHAALARRYQRFAASCEEGEGQIQAGQLLTAWALYEEARDAERKAAAKRLRALRSTPAAARAWRSRMACLGQAVEAGEGRGAAQRRLSARYAPTFTPTLTKTQVLGRQAMIKDGGWAQQGGPVTRQTMGKLVEAEVADWTINVPGGPWEAHLLPGLDVLLWTDARRAVLTDYPQAHDFQQAMPLFRH